MSDSLNISRNTGNFNRMAKNIVNSLKTGMIQQSDADKASTAVANNGAQEKSIFGFGFSFKTNGTACSSTEL